MRRSKSDYWKSGYGLSLGHLQGLVLVSMAKSRE
jgi:hypothetical protein